MGKATISALMAMGAAMATLPSNALGGGGYAGNTFTRKLCTNADSKAVGKRTKRRNRGKFGVSQ